MISKSDTLKMFSKTIDNASSYDHASIVANVSEVENIIETIYDSIGSCGECAYYEESKSIAKVKNMICMHHNMDADGGFFIPKDKYFFCAYFERKA